MANSMFLLWSGSKPLKSSLLPHIDHGPKGLPASGNLFGQGEQEQFSVTCYREDYERNIAR